MMHISRTIENGNLQMALSYSSQKILLDDPQTKSMGPLAAEIPQVAWMCTWRVMNGPYLENY